jgi:hypothetical protein
MNRAERFLFILPKHRAGVILHSSIIPLHQAFDARLGASLFEHLPPIFIFIFDLVAAQLDVSIDLTRPSPHISWNFWLPQRRAK